MAWVTSVFQIWMECSVYISFVLQNISWNSGENWTSLKKSKRYIWNLISSKHVRCEDCMYPLFSGGDFCFQLHIYSVHCLLYFPRHFQRNLYGSIQMPEVINWGVYLAGHTWPGLSVTMHAIILRDSCRFIVKRCKDGKLKLNVHAP